MMMQSQDHGYMKEGRSVGHFPSIPWIPYYCNQSTSSWNLVRCESSGVRSLAAAGRLDFTPMATVDWFELKEDWQRIGGWGIAFKKVAGSVLLFSHRPISDLDAAPIAICDETTTSVRILQALLQKKYGLRIGRWRRNVDVNDGETPRLLIQNQAVEEVARGRFPYVADLGSEWWAWQGTPIVTAVWAGRADIPGDERAAFAAQLEGASRTYHEAPERAVKAHRETFGWSAEVESVVALHRNFDYLLGRDCEAGIERMRQILPLEVAGFAS